MSDANPDFALRKNKFVDRRVFVDALARMRCVRPLEEYLYIGMGGSSLEDHRAIHSILGIEMLLSFDEDADKIERQKLNAPSGKTRYLHATSKELVDQLEAILRREGFPSDAGRIIWLDYMRPGQLGHQLQEFRGLLSILEANDIVKITLNADPESLGQKKGSYDDLTTYRINVLKSRLGEFGPAKLTDADVTIDGFAKTLARAVEKVANDAFARKSGLRLAPLSLIRYADGLQMLTVTGVLLDRAADAASFLKRTGFETWPLYSPAWDRIHHVDIPYLTPQERALLDREMFRSEGPESLRVFFGGNAETAVEQYKLFRRYYPNFQHVWF
jgi:hypothetical protein